MLPWQLQQIFCAVYSPSIIMAWWCLPSVCDCSVTQNHLTLLRSLGGMQVTLGQSRGIPCPHQLGSKPRANGDECKAIGFIIPAGPENRGSSKGLVPVVDLCVSPCGSWCLCADRSGHLSIWWFSLEEGEPSEAGLEVYLSLERRLLCSNKLSSLGPTLPPHVCLGFASLVLKWCSSFPENLGQEESFVQEASVRYSHRADGSRSC